MNVVKRLTTEESMENLGLDMKLSTEDVVSMVVVERQQKLRAEGEILLGKIKEIDSIANDSTFNNKVKSIVDGFIKDNNLPNHVGMSYSSDYDKEKMEARLTLSLSFELPTEGLDEILKIRKEKEPELRELNQQLRTLHEKMSNIKMMERETRAHLARLKLEAMGQNALIDSLITPTPKLPQS